ncbi:P63C domain-containing protein [Priestia aryabhattai]|jgi:P63C domain|uniref:P63C domain-containing protein n=1 Tax=Priestia aryabhattai TaxID=412384 RepID=UPI0027E4439C|nr:P63C domain-containing protein [Priestia aryabhattai]MCG0050224.1 P63C domain-containing protein [Priestia aryabhattai]
MTEESKILKATHFGKLNLGEKELTCAVLEDGSRIISRNAIFRAFGRTKRGRKKGEVRVANMPELPSFIDANNLTQYITGEIRELLINPVVYRAQNGREVEGYKAQIIPLMCDVYLSARMDKVLTKQQENLAIVSEILVRSLSKLGIVALVDEATGYQAERDKDELQRLLSKYISKELLPWVKRFPDEFYQEMFRLRGWDYPTVSGQRPGIVGHYTNQFVYDHLPPGVKEELQKNNPSVAPGKRKYKHHQFLTDDIGNVHLEKHLLKVITLMQASETWSEFLKKFNRVFGVVEQIELDLDQEA